MAASTTHIARRSGNKVNVTCLRFCRLEIQCAINLKPTESLQVHTCAGQADRFVAPNITLRITSHTHSLSLSSFSPIVFFPLFQTRKATSCSRTTWTAECIAQGGSEGEGERGMEEGRRKREGGRGGGNLPLVFGVQAVCGFEWIK